MFVAMEGNVIDLYKRCRDHNSMYLYDLCNVSCGSEESRDRVYDHLYRMHVMLEELGRALESSPGKCGLNALLASTME